MRYYQDIDEVVTLLRKSSELNQNRTNRNFLLLTTISCPNRTTKPLTGVSTMTH